MNNINLRSKAGKGERAFTLVEVLVSVSIFAMVMLIATGSVFSIVEANKKTHTLKSVMTNLNFALESMARDTRVGFNYVCDGSGSCQSGGSVFRYKANRDIDGDGNYNSADANDQIEYSLVSGRIQKRVYGTIPSTTDITASDINITLLRFYVTGTAANDGLQPKVVMTLKGDAGTGKTKSEFNIQTTISQRAIDS
ncbi:MAG: type II secretion system protein [Candidatus Taylorbacteria bacterium]|nr:type II secretion system protein [Candidatus Taylorbacteria bacterium]